MSRISVPACLVMLALSTWTLGNAADERHVVSHDNCAKACSDCQRSCELCSTHCSKMLMEGKKEHMATLETCRDCATVCSAAASIVARKGPFAEMICTSCAEACKQCALECEKHKDDPMMKRCAEQCRACESACKEMLQRTVAKTPAAK